MILHQRPFRTAYDILSLRKSRDRLENIGVDGKVILNIIFKKWDREALTVLIWFRIGTGDVIL
jgi:hypothetical protein